MVRIIIRLNAWFASLLMTLRKGKKVDWKQKLIDLTNILKKIMNLIPIKSKRRNFFKRLKKRG